MNSNKVPSSDSQVECHSHMSMIDVEVRMLASLTWQEILQRGQAAEDAIKDWGRERPGINNINLMHAGWESAAVQRAVADTCAKRLWDQTADVKLEALREAWAGAPVGGMRNALERCIERAISREAAAVEAARLKKEQDRHWWLLSDWAEREVEDTRSKAYRDAWLAICALPDREARDRMRQASWDAVQEQNHHGFWERWRHTNVEDSYACAEDAHQCQLSHTREDAINDACRAWNYEAQMPYVAYPDLRHLAVLVQQDSLDAACAVLGAKKSLADLVRGAFRDAEARKAEKGGFWTSVLKWTLNARLRRAGMKEDFLVLKLGMLVTVQGQHAACVQQSYEDSGMPAQVRYRMYVPSKHGGGGRDVKLIPERWDTAARWTVVRPEVAVLLLLLSVPQVWIAYRK